MKRLYTIPLLALLLVTLSSHLSAQTAGRAYIGYAKYSDQIWEADGFSINVDAKVGCAILLTKDMLEPYYGGTIVGMRVGWDISSKTGKYEGFVRNSLNGEDLSTGSATVRYSYTSAEPGWNNMTMSEYVIPEGTEQLAVGFFTNLKKGEIAIPKVYPSYVKHSCYLWVDGDFDNDGNPVWYDNSSQGILPILLTVKDTEGTFSYLPVITFMLDDGVVTSDAAATTLMRVQNKGAQTIKSLEFTTRYGDEVYQQKVTLSKNIPQGATSGLFMAPLYCFGSGDVELSITKVNDKDVANPPSRKVNLIGVPSSISSKYKKRPLMEYFESENNYRSAGYFDEYIEPNMLGKLNKYTLVCQHLDDQFMTGDDDATTLALLLCDNDSSAVSIPNMSIDRSISTDNFYYQQVSRNYPMFDVLITPGNTYDNALKHPTFVAVQAAGNLGDDNETLTIEVKGDVAAGVLPSGEAPNLTVYLMEHFVLSDSQLFRNDKEKEDYMGEYVHFNVIREILTEVNGNPINAEGEFTANYTTTLDPSWNPENLYIVAFVHRNGALGGKRMQVFNSTEGQIDLTNGIGKIQAEGSKMGNDAVYDLSGRHLSNLNASTINLQSMKKGLYIVNGKKVVR